MPSFGATTCEQLRQIDSSVLMESLCSKQINFHTGFLPRPSCCLRSLAPQFPSLFRLHLFKLASFLSLTNRPLSFLPLSSVLPPVGSEKDPGHSDTGEAPPERRDGGGPWLQSPGLHRDGRPNTGTDSGPPATQEVRVPLPQPHTLTPSAPYPPHAPQPTEPRLTDRHKQTDKRRTDTGERHTDTAM